MASMFGVLDVCKAEVSKIVDKGNKSFVRVQKLSPNCLFSSSTCSSAPLIILLLEILKRNRGRVGCFILVLKYSDYFQNSFLSVKLFEFSKNATSIKCI